MQINKAARESEMLGTLALAAPKTADFQFVRFKIEGEVAHLTLDRPEHNLLNERVLMELVAGINSVSETREVKLILLDSASRSVPLISTCLAMYAAAIRSASLSALW